MTVNSIFIFLVSLSVHFSLFASPERAQYNLPLYFEENDGQLDQSVKYSSHNSFCNLYFTPDEIFMMVVGRDTTSVLKIQFTESHASTLVGVDQLAHKSHYFIGNDESKWLKNVSNYAKVLYKDVYAGVDAVFYGKDGQLEYDLFVAPGSDPENICLHIEGAKSLSLDDKGNLQMLTADDQTLIMRKPVVYQESSASEKSLIEGQFILRTQNEVGFKIGAYDPSKLLVIDPVLTFSSYLGANEGTAEPALAVDDSGNVYLVGGTYSATFPITPGAYQTNLIGAVNYYVSKLNVTTSQLVYSTFLGGNVTVPAVADIAIDVGGNAYIMGTTTSSTFPTTPGAFQTTLNGTTNCFITKLNPTGSGLVYSTYLGGSASDTASAIAIDSLGNAFVNGYTNSNDFPVTGGSYQTALNGTTDCFVTKLNATGTALIYSTYLGGSTINNASGIAIDTAGNAYVAGFTTSADFPTTVGAFQTVFGGGTDGFITKLNPAGSALVYSTFLGGGGDDTILDIDLDSSDNAYLTGATTSANFPTTPGVFQTVYSGGVYDAFITKLNASGSSLVYSTYLGTGGITQSWSIEVASNGNAYIGGLTTATDFPVTLDAFQSAAPGPVSAIFTIFDSVASSLVYSTYLGGSGQQIFTKVALDSLDNAYVSGITTSTDFPVTPNAYQPTAPDVVNSYISVFGVNSPLVVNPVTNFQAVSIKNKFALQTDYVNYLTWTPSSSVVEGYRLYRDGILIAVIPAAGPFAYYDHNLERNRTYVYTIVAFNAVGESLPVTAIPVAGSCS